MFPKCGNVYFWLLLWYFSDLNSPKIRQITSRGSKQRLQEVITKYPQLTNVPIGDFYKVQQHEATVVRKGRHPRPPSFLGMLDRYRQFGRWWEEP